jgi:hypothetical protein
VPPAKCAVMALRPTFALEVAMRLSPSLLRFAVMLGAVVGAGCDREVDPVTAPAKFPSGPNALIVSTGYSDVSLSSAPYGCAVRAVDGGVVCWGDNDYQRATPPAGKYRQVSAGSQHACALRADYYVVCWGAHDYGETSPPSITFSQISAGNRYSCGVRMDNRLLACWGYNPTALTNVPATVAFTQVTTGDRHTCGLTFGDNRVLCWGQNDYGQANSPQGVFTQVDVGSTYTCAVRSTGTVGCWGSNFAGEILAPAGTYTQVSAASSHTCAIRAVDRAAVCWGEDNNGVLSPPSSAYTKVSAGGSNACAIRASDLAVVCWGNNTSGQSSPPGISTAHTPPSATFGGSVVFALDTFVLNLSSARVNGFPQATSFTYQFDCGDGKGYGTAQAASYARCPTRVAGTRSVRGKVIDQDGDTASYGMALAVKFRPDTVKFTSTAPNPALVGATYTPSATAKSGLPVTISSTSLNYCLRSGNVITFTRIGGCTIAADAKGDSTWAPAVRATQSIIAIWPFSGFFSPVWNVPNANRMTAGRYVRIPFSVGGNVDFTGAVVPSGTASTQAVTCEPNVYHHVDVLGEPVGTAGVTYDPTTKRYTLTWKTDASWAGSCRVVTVTLNDGTTHTLRFAFK